MMMTKITLRILLILVFLVGLLEVNPFLAQAQPTPGVLSGTIESPPGGSAVPRHFDIEGTVYNQWRHLWIIERIGNLYWPKEPELQPSKNRWRGEVYEGGHPPQGRFEILLVDVSDNVSRMFNNWLQRGHRTGSYPGITTRSLGNIKVLDKKEYHLQY
jgi:hypothetical protein